MIEYVDDIHTYLIDGVIVPSVSELCQFATQKSFEGIPKDILNAKAEYGTKLHAFIQEYEETQRQPEELKTSSIFLKAAFKDYLCIRDEHIKNPVCEMIVSYKDKYAGRLDILDGTTLIDIKSTYKLDVDWLQWQLGYYKLALEDMGKSVTKCFCLWLLKGKAGKWVEINPRFNWELMENYARYTDQK